MNLVSRSARVKALGRKTFESEIEILVGVRLAIHFHAEVIEPRRATAGKEHAEAFEAMIEDAVKERSEVNAVLTPEQLDQLKSLKKEKCAQAKGREAHHPDR